MTTGPSLFDNYTIYCMYICCMYICCMSYLQPLRAIVCGILLAADSKLTAADSS